MENIDYKTMATEIAKAIKGESRGMGYDPEKIKDFEESAEDFTNSIKKSNPGLKMFRNMLTGTGGSFVDITDHVKSLNRALEKEEELIKQTQFDKTKQSEMNAAIDNRDRLLKQKGQAVQAALFTNTAILAQKVGGVIYSTEMDFAKTAADFQKELHRSTDGTKLYAELQIKTIQKAAEAADKIGEVATEVGEMVSAVGLVVKRFKYLYFIIGGIMTLLGGGTKLLKDGTELAVKGLEDLNGQVEGLRIGFKEINSAGITLAGGMDQLNRNAIEFGLMPERFAKGLEGAKDDIKNLGMSTSNATQKIASLGHALDQGGVTASLYKLGYSFEDQIGVLTGAMAQMQIAGTLRSASDKQIADQTLNYGKSLKIIEQITGKNAKEQLARAKTAAAEAAIFGQLNPQQRKAFMNAMATVPEEMKDIVVKGFAAKLHTGSVFFTEAADAIYAQTNPAILGLVEGIGRVAMSGVDDLKQTSRDVGSMMETVYKGNERASQQYGDMAFAGAVGHQAVVNSWYQKTSKMNELAMTQEEGRAKEIAVAVEATTHNLSKLDNAVLASETAMKNSAIATAASADTLASHIINTMNTTATPVASLKDAALASSSALMQFAARLDLISPEKAQTGNWWDDWGKNTAIAAAGGAMFAGGTALSGTGIGAVIGTPLAYSGLGLMAYGVGKGTERTLSTNVFGKQGAGGATQTTGAAGSKIALNFSHTRPGDTGDEAHWAQMPGGTKEKFMNLLAEAGVTNATILSSYRSAQEQAELSTSHPKAGPGLSAHNQGNGIDVDPGTYQILRTRPDLAAKYKVKFLETDPNHLEFYKNGGYIPGGKRGIVGDGGMEMVEGPAHVTSVDNSMAVFKKMAENIEKLVLITKNDTRLDDILTELESQSRSNQKILTAVS